MHNEQKSSTLFVVEPKHRRRQQFRTLSFSSSFSIDVVDILFSTLLCFTLLYSTGYV